MVKMKVRGDKILQTVCSNVFAEKVLLIFFKVNTQEQSEIELVKASKVEA